MGSSDNSHRQNKASRPTRPRPNERDLLRVRHRPIARASKSAINNLSQESITNSRLDRVFPTDQSRTAPSRLDRVFPTDQSRTAPTLHEIKPGWVGWDKKILPGSRRSPRPKMATAITLKRSRTMHADLMPECGAPIPDLPHR